MARSKEYRVKIKIKGGFQDKECQGIMWIILVVMVEVPLKVSLAREGMEMALKHKFACSLSKKIYSCVCQYVAYRVLSLVLNSKS